MNNALLWGVLAGFLIGGFFYIVINIFWAPVFAYRKIRNRLDEDLQVLLMSSRKDTLNRRDIQIIERFYGHAKALELYYEKTMPAWYKHSLMKKGEKIREAIPELLSLAAIKNPSHLEKRILRVRGLLFANKL